MLRLLVVFIAVAGVSVLAGCNMQKEESASALPAGTGNLESGAWNAACDTTDNMKSSITFASGNYSGTVTYYSAANCTTESLKIVQSGPYSATGLSFQGQGQIDWTIQEMLVTPMIASQATNMNMISYCGYTDWAATVSKSIIGRTCGSITIAAGDVRYDIYSIEQFDVGSAYGVLKGDLTFGLNDSNLDGSTPAKRPTTIDGTLRYRH